VSLQAQHQAKAILELRRRRVKTGPRLDPYARFQQIYRNNPAGFIIDCVDWRDEAPAVYQLDSSSKLNSEKRVSVRAPHGAGKTSLAAWLVHWFALTRDGTEDWKIPTTASVWRQLTHYLWPEIRKWARRLRWDKIGRRPYHMGKELLMRSLKLSTGEAFALASNEPELIEGAHAAQLLYVFDESKIIPDATWDSAEGAFSTGSCYWLAISTPGPPQGRFYDIHSHKPGYEDWYARHVTLAEAIAEKRIDADWAAARKRQWGADSAVYKNRVLGEFAASQESSVIALSWVEAANERWQAWKDADGELPPLTAVGVDVGRGGDLSVQALRYGNILAELRRDNERDTMKLTGKVKGVLDRYGGRAVIDVVGVGAGVFDRLREQHATVVPFNAGAATKRKDSTGELGFVNVRSAAWWALRELLGDPNSEIALPPDDQLTGDLTAPTWSTTSAGKYSVEKKDEIRKRIGRSTDDGDAVIMAFWQPEDTTQRYGGSVSTLDEHIARNAPPPTPTELARNVRVRYLGKRQFPLNAGPHVWMVSEGWSKVVERELGEQLAGRFPEHFIAEELSN
jgi:hypothetical protein